MSIVIVPMSARISSRRARCGVSAPPSAALERARLERAFQSARRPPRGVPSAPPSAAHAPKASAPVDSFSKSPSAITKLGPKVEMPITVAVCAAYPSTSSTYTGVVSSQPSW
jgi:hypothetical protein